MLRRIRNWFNSNKVHEGATTDAPLPRSWTCPVCQKDFGGYDALQQHYKDVHLRSLLRTIPGTEDDSGPVVECPKCGLFMSEDEYQQFHRGTNNCPEYDDQGDQNVQHR
jgi:rubredoxin